MVGEWKSTKSAGGNLKSGLACTALTGQGRRMNLNVHFESLLKAFSSDTTKVHPNIFHNIYILSTSIQRKNRTNISSSWFMHQIFSTENFLNYLHCTVCPFFCQWPTPLWMIGLMTIMKWLKRHILTLYKTKPVSLQHSIECGQGQNKWNTEISTTRKTEVCIILHTWVKLNWIESWQSIAFSEYN